MMVGVVRFNFTIDTGITAEDLKAAILNQLKHVPGLDIANNTMYVGIEVYRVPENPPMPEFHKVKGIVRER